MKAYFCPYGFWTTEDVLYCIGLIVLALGGGAAILLYAVPELSAKILLPCPVHFFTGLYCPGCGGTRALKYLLHGDIAASLRHHPAVLYVAIVGGIFMLSQTISRILRGRVRAMRYRNIYLYILIALYAFNFLWKNIALLVFQVRVIA